MAKKTYEKKAFKFAVDAVDAETGTFTGYASTFGEMDLVGDIVVRGAFKKTLSEKPHFPLNWVHDSTHPLGIVRAAEDKRGLKIEGELNMDVQSAREKRSLMKQGAVTGVSIGYDAINPGFDKETGARLLKEIKLYEISLCEFPACLSAQVTDVKTSGELLEDEEALREEPGEPTLIAEPHINKNEPVIDHSVPDYAAFVRKSISPKEAN